MVRPNGNVSVAQPLWDFGNWVGSWLDPGPQVIVIGNHRAIVYGGTGPSPPGGMLSGEVRGFWQKQFQNKQITEEGLRKLLHPEDVAQILKNLGQKAGKVPHNKVKIIDSIQKTTDAATRAADDFAQGRITQEKFDELMRKLEEISRAQRLSRQ